MINAILALTTGYLLGSISPSYFLGRWLKKIDIRLVGDKNAGATNVYKQLGLVPAVITGIYDISKGLISIYIATLLGVNELTVYLVGIFAILGHIFPFYLDFRGGQGASTAVGLLFYFLIKLNEIHLFPFASLAVIALVILAILVITWQKGFLAFIAMPALIFIILKNYPINLIAFFASLVSLHLLIVSTYEAVRHKIFKLKTETIKKISPWRTMLRPLSVIFPISYFYLDKNIILLIVGAIGFVFLIVDLARLFNKKINYYYFERVKYLFKKGEQKRFSSITLFFFSMFVTIFLFDKYIAIAAITFLIFGDVFAKFFGSEYGKTKIGKKTFEGSVAFFSASVISGYMLKPYIGLDQFTIIMGALSAALAELAPIGINDNFSIALISAIVMTLVKNYL
jgi:glycerol-3-phosphate acyltransferase PlsY